jgi:hypothetical protein
MAPSEHREAVRASAWLKPAGSPPTAVTASTTTIVFPPPVDPADQRAVSALLDLN